MNYFFTLRKAFWTCLALGFSKGITNSLMGSKIRCALALVKRLSSNSLSHEYRHHVQLDYWHSLKPSMEDYFDDIPLVRLLLPSHSLERPKSQLVRQSL